MLVDLKRRYRGGESGFTLIELLVVMIIIAILMAIAVPTFLSQKQKAVATKAKTNAKNIADVIDACAASTPDGNYTGSGYNCVSASMISQNEPSLGALIGSGPGKVKISNTSSEGYVIVSTSDTSNGATEEFTITKTPSLVSNTCKKTGQIGSSMCPAGVW